MEVAAYQQVEQGGRHHQGETLVMGIPSALATPLNKLRYAWLISSINLLISSINLEHAHEFVRRQVSFAREDKIFAEDISKLKHMLESLTLWTRASRHDGP